MVALTSLEWVVFFIVTTLAAATVLWAIGTLQSKRTPNGRTAPPLYNSNHFLFEDNILVDHDVNDPGFPDTVETWDDLRKWLAPRFEGLPKSLIDLPANHRAEFTANGRLSDTALHLQRHSAQTNFTLTDKSIRSAAAWHSTLSSIQTETTARAILAAAPDPIWRTDAEGAVLWKNDACKRISDPEGNLPQIASTPNTCSSNSSPTISIEDKHGGENRWFELRSSQDGEHHLHFATDTTQIVNAETAQRDFVQTLTKTFANLTIGLAIFDKNRQLALFNPALVDLTNAPVTFLSARPDLMAFFDQLRERQVMPEPKNYANWRSQIRDAVAQANKGLYQEMWTLPNGLSYRVTGRPHPNGAVAFLFEDISAEISLTRRFRSQIELRQSVLDGMKDAIVVIGSNNLVLFCNKPCTELLQIDPDSSFADMSLRDLLAICRQTFGNPVQWQSFERSLTANTASGPLEVTFPTKNGTRFICSIKPLPGGVKMLSISAPVQAHLSVAG